MGSAKPQQENSRREPSIVLGKGVSEKKNGVNNLALTGSSVSNRGASARLLQGSTGRAECTSKALALTWRERNSD